MRRRSPGPHFARRRRLVEGRTSRAAAVVLSLLVLVGVPVLVVLLASKRTVSGTPVGAGTDVPAAADPHRPAAPFFARTGDGVRPNGIGCSSSAQDTLTARAHLDVIADRRPVTVPGGIGVLSTCVYWVHTGAADGVIAIGSPERRTFRLGDLFDIWGAPLGRDRLLAFEVSARRPLRVFVDGRVVRKDPRDIELRDGREIALVLGARPATVPSRFPGR